MLKKVKDRLDKLEYHQKTLQVEYILLSLLNNLDDLNLSALERFVEMREVDIELREWDYTCGDGCCYNWGTDLLINDKEPVDVSGESVEQSLEAVLHYLGVKCKIRRTWKGIDQY